MAGSADTKKNFKAVTIDSFDLNSELPVYFQDGDFTYKLVCYLGL